MMHWNGIQKNWISKSEKILNFLKLLSGNFSSIGVHFMEKTRKLNGKMLIMRVNKDFQYRVGFGSYEPNKSRYSISKIIYYSVMMIFTFITACVALIVHSDDFGYFVITVFPFSLYVMMLSSYFTTLYHRMELQILLTELQEIVNRRK